jgi:hypothetical protein
MPWIPLARAPLALAAHELREAQEGRPTSALPGIIALQPRRMAAWLHHRLLGPDRIEVLTFKGLEDVPWVIDFELDLARCIVRRLAEPAKIYAQGHPLELLSGHELRTVPDVSEEIDLFWHCCWTMLYFFHTQKHPRVHLRGRARGENHPRLLSRDIWLGTPDWLAGTIVTKAGQVWADVSVKILTKPDVSATASKSAREREIANWLKTEMLLSPEDPRPKQELFAECKNAPSWALFERAWSRAVAQARAIEKTTRWGLPGRLRS